MANASFDAGLKWLAEADNCQLIRGGLRGLEKECLRVTPDGTLSARPHSERFGSALTHPWITTDYSEALLEFVTPPTNDNASALQFLEEMQAFVVRNMDDEQLWPASMPCVMNADRTVPIASYGSSNQGQLRTVYRSGLGFRYGKAMQTIAGTHFNYSLPAEFWPAWGDHREAGLELAALRSETLLGMARNYRRHGWIVSYLFGASPAFCKSFMPQGHRGLESLDAHSWYAPFSTSLRMSDMGYRNSTQARLAVSLDSVDQYISELTAALTTRDPRYEAIGVEVDGEYRQLNANVLQLENEHYSSIRPKPASKEPRLIAALRAQGIEYLEVRSLDLNPFDRVGLARDQADFIELLLLYCLLCDSPPLAAAELEETDSRDLGVAWEGRRPGLKLPFDGQAVVLAERAGAMMDELEGLAHLLDGSAGSYQNAVRLAREAVRDPARTLSAQVLESIRDSGLSFAEWALATGRNGCEQLLRYEFPPGRLAELEQLATDSLRQQQQIEAADSVSFSRYLEAFTRLIDPGS